MTMDDLREQFRRDEEDEVKDVKQVSKALILAALAPSLYERLAFMPDPAAYDDDFTSMARLRRQELETENIRRAVLLADRLADAAFGGNTNGRK